MKAIIRTAALLIGFCAVPLHAGLNSDNDCIVQAGSGEGKGASWRTVSREACLAGAHLAGEQPALSTELIKRGPAGPAVAGPPTEYCSFIPYDMHLKSRGMSLKFWCYRTDAQGRYYGDDRTVAAEATGVSPAGVLIDARGQPLRDDTGRARRPEIIKVKYTTGSSRGREVYTEVAVHRFLWALGFPADHMFRATVVCKGCSRDPFSDIRTAADNRPSKATNTFAQASIERKAWNPLDSTDDEGWKWEDVYAMWSGNPDKRVQLEAYVLALNLVHFHNGLAKQNTLACDPRTWDPATSKCGHPVIFLDDPGSSFGGGSSRGDYGEYRNQRVFLNAGSCTLAADLAGFGRPSEAARRFLVERLNNLTPEGVRAIFESAGFNESTTGGSVDAWSSMFQQRIEEVRHASCN